MGPLTEQVNGAGLALQSVLRELKVAGVALADIDFVVAGFDVSRGAVRDD